MVDRVFAVSGQYLETGSCVRCKEPRPPACVCLRIRGAWRSRLVADESSCGWEDQPPNINNKNTPTPPRLSYLRSLTPPPAVTLLRPLSIFEVATRAFAVFLIITSYEPARLSAPLLARRHHPTVHQSLPLFRRPQNIALNAVYFYQYKLTVWLRKQPNWAPWGGCTRLGYSQT